MKMKREHEVHCLTGTLISQIMYQSSKLTQKDHNFNEITKEIDSLMSRYKKKVKKLRD